MSPGAFSRYINQFKEPVRKQKVYIFLVCLACSGLFWLIIKLSNPSQAVFSRFVAIDGVPEGMVLHDPPVQEVFYTWQTTGIRLILLRVLYDRDTLSVPLLSMPYLNQDGLVRHYITASTINNMLNSRLDQGRQISMVRPDTVFFGLTEGVHKKLPLEIPVDATFDRNYYLYGAVKLVPDSVVISGPRSIVDTIQVARTETVSYLALNQTVTGYVKVVPPVIHPAVQISPDLINYTIHVEEFTESQLEISLNIICPEGFSAYDPEKLKLFPEKVSCTFKVALRDFQRIDESMFSAYVECPDLLQGKRQLHVHMGLYPEFVQIEAIRPSVVDFLIMH